MKLVGILSGQAVLIFVLDSWFDARLGLWLLYFLPLLGTARVPGVRVTLVGGIVLSLLILVGGLFKIGQVPWQEILVPRALAVYALGLTAVLLIRGKQFSIQAMNAVANVASDPTSEGAMSLLRTDLDFARERLLILSRELTEARLSSDVELAGKRQADIERVLEAVGARLGVVREVT